MARTVQNRVYLECGSECGADPMATGSPFRRRRKRRRKRRCLWETPLEKARWGPTAAFLVSPSGMAKDLEEDRKNTIEGGKWRYGRFLGDGNKTSYIIQRQLKRGVKITSNPFPEIGFVKHSCENMGSFELKSSAASAASRDGNLNIRTGNRCLSHPRHFDSPPIQSDKKSGDGLITRLIKKIRRFLREMARAQGSAK